MAGWYGYGGYGDAAGKILAALRLSIFNPGLAARSCALCRKYHYDEETGLPVKDRRGDFRLRRGPVPCEFRGDNSRGCPKGHWKNEPDLNARQAAVVRYWWSVRGTMGGCVSASDRSSRWLMWFLGVMSEEYESTVRLMEAAETKTLLTLLVRHD